MRSETLSAQQPNGFLHGRLRQLSWITAVIMSAVFWVGLLVLIF